MRLESRQRTRAADDAPVPVPAAVDLIPDIKQPELHSHSSDSLWQTGCLLKSLLLSQRPSYPDVNYRDNGSDLGHIGRSVKTDTAREHSG